MTKDIKDYLQDSISILLAFCFACTIETTQVADGLYDMEKLSTLLPEGALIEDIMYETYDELCGWEQSEIDAIIETWEINNKTDVEFVDIEPRLRPK